MFNPRLRRSFLPLACLAILSVVPVPGQCRQDWTDSPLSSESQVVLEKAMKLMRSGKFDRAAPMVLSALESANDIPKCVAIANYTETFATPMMDVRRQCMQKALSLAQSRQDFIVVALKARQFQFFEITRQAINSLIQSARTVPDLLDLARKAQEVALSDVAHMSMERAYSGIRTVPEAIKFAGECKAMGMDDLARKVMRDLIDDEDSAPQLCALLPKLEPLGMADLNRYLLKKALDKAMTVEDHVCIMESARRNREQDIFKLAEYRGKKLKLINQIKADREAYQQQLQAWQEGIQQDLARQQSEAEQNNQSGQGNAADAAGGGTDSPPSGF